MGRRAGGLGQVGNRDQVVRHVARDGDPDAASHHGYRAQIEAQEGGSQALCEVEVRHGDSWYLLRTALRGVTGKLLQAVGVAIPPSVQPLDTVVPRP